MSQSTSQQTPILKVDHLTMRFGGLVAIDDVSMEASRGNITAIIGPNGAGKTTVFNCLTGFYKPTVGMITMTRADGRQFLLERLDDHIIARNAGLDFAPMALVRHRPTERQVGLSASARARNVQGAFRVPVESRPLIEGRGVLLVDDVYTTGATVKACAGALKRPGAARVDVLTFGSVPGGDI